MSTVGIEDGDIVIRIPIRSLSGEAWQGLDAVGYEDDDSMDWHQLAADIVVELETESEDGTTPIHEMLDQAVISASENGAEAFAYLDEPGMSNPGERDYEC